MRRQRRGTEAIEFALILPVAIALIAGMVDYGWFFSQQMLLQDAVRHGARVGSVTALDDGPAEAARKAVAQNLEDIGASFDPAVEVQLRPASNGEQVVEVIAEAPYTGLWRLVASPYELDARVVMRLEEQPPRP